MRGMIISAAGAAMLTACGVAETEGQTGPEADQNNIRTDREAASDGRLEGATAQSASAQREIDCETVQGQTAPSGEAADDVIGIRQGMTIDQVRAIIACKDPNYVVKENRTPLRLQDNATLSQVYFNADSGLDDVTVSLIGPEGDERVTKVVRTVEYVDGQGLPIDAVKLELERKYGAFDDRSDIQGYIIRTRGGQRIGKNNSHFRRCTGWGDEGGETWRTAPSTPCGEVIGYRIYPDREEKDIAARFVVAVSDLETASRLIDQATRAAEQAQADRLKQAKDKVQKGGVDL